MRVAKRFRRVLTVLLAVSLAGTVHSVDRAQFVLLNQKAAGLARQKDWPAFRQALLEMRELMPGNLTPRWLLRMASVEARLGHTSEALRWLHAFARMGLVFDVAQDPDLAPLVSEAEFKAVAEQFQENRKETARATVACVIPQSDLMPEDITYDSAHRWFVITSIRHHGLYRLRLPGAAGTTCDLEELAMPPRAKAWPAMAVSHDDRRHLLWMTASAMPDFTGVPGQDQGKAVLLARKDKTGEILHEVPSLEGDPAVFGDMTLAENGVVYLTASIGGGIYRLNPTAGKPALEKIAQGFSPQTPVLAADGKRLLVADYPMGIAVVDLSHPSTTELHYLPHPDDIAVTGIDGLYRAGDSLIAVQNGTSPARLLRLRLNPGQTAIVSAEVLEQSPHSMDSNHAVMIGDSLYFLSNVGWDEVDDHGNLKEGAAFTRPVLMRLRLAE